MSMGLRGAVIFLPLCCSLWLPGRIAPKYALASIVTGPSMVLLFGLWDILPCDPLFVGMLASLSIMGLGFYNSKKKQ
jgi:SSS family solute:Na+ symporter